MFEKLVSFTKRVSDLADKPSLNSIELKAQFDAAPDEVRTYLNKLVDALSKNTAGDSGAKNIGATNITGLTGMDVQTLLESLKSYADLKFALSAQMTEANATLQNGWINSNADQKARYWKDSFGIVHVNGRIQSGTFADSTVLLNVPVGYRPKETVYFRGSPSFQMETTGNLRIYNCSGNTDVGFDGFHYRAYN